MCLDQEGITSEKDKALFGYKNLEGEAEQRVSHLLRPHYRTKQAIKVLHLEGRGVTEATLTGPN